MNLGNEEKIGVLGGGQLGLMLYQASETFNIELSFLDPDPNAPCSHVPDGFKIGDFKNESDVVAFGRDKDVVTIEIENVNTSGLRKLQDLGVTVFPDPDLIDIVKDKGLQKEFYNDHSIPTSPFSLFNDKVEFINAIRSTPTIQKLRTGGYDGKGVQVIRSPKDFIKIFDAPSVMEEYIDLECEISVIVARNKSGATKTFPAVGMDFNKEANLVEYLYSPARLTVETAQKAESLAQKLAGDFNLVGIMAVEMFIANTGEILVNEVAPRPHNSGHQTIEGNVTSQYEQHLRSILNLPLGSTEITKPSVMVNLLGSKNYTGPVLYKGMKEVENELDVYVHLYEKKITRPFRKMGHITVLRDNLDDAVIKAQEIKNNVKCVS